MGLSATLQINCCFYYFFLSSEIVSLKLIPNAYVDMLSLPCTLVELDLSNDITLHGDKSKNIPGISVAPQISYC